MIRTVLNFVAGVDRKTLETCPATDKMWAAHLGFSLCLSFLVVLGVSFHATGYMIDDITTRALVALVIALTVLMFDRALCQSDWFYQGSFWNGNPSPQSSAEARQSTWRFGRIAIRLVLSLGLAWVIAMFLELAIFSGTINDKIERDRVAANQPIFQKIAQYDAQLGAEIDRRREAAASLEGLLQAALHETPPIDQAALVRSENVEQQIKALIAREGELRAEQRQIEQTVQRYAADMNAEEFGQKNSPTNSGRAGTGPRYEFAKRQKEIFQAQSAAREAEIAQLRAKADELRAVQARIAAEAEQTRDRERATIAAKRDALQLQVNAARADIRQLETDRATAVDEFRRKVMTESYYQEKKDKADPLTRMAAYQELKNDPKDGGTIALFSWMTRFFIIFLEIVPVVAKIFFSPPSVYAAKIQAEVDRERRRIEQAASEPLPPLEPQPERRPRPSLGSRLARTLFKKSEPALNNAAAATARSRGHTPAHGNGHHANGHYAHAAKAEPAATPAARAAAEHRDPQPRPQPRLVPQPRREGVVLREAAAAGASLAAIPAAGRDRPEPVRAAPVDAVAAVPAAAVSSAALTNAYFDDRTHPATMPEQAELRDIEPTPPDASAAGQGNGGFSSMHYSLRYGALQSP